MGNAAVGANGSQYSCRSIVWPKAWSTAFWRRPKATVSFGPTLPTLMCVYRVLGGSIHWPKEPYHFTSATPVISTLWTSALSSHRVTSAPSPCINMLSIDLFRRLRRYCSGSESYSARLTSSWPNGRRGKICVQHKNSLIRDMNQRKI